MKIALEGINKLFKLFFVLQLIIVFQMIFCENQENMINKYMKNVKDKHKKRGK